MKNSQEPGKLYTATRELARGVSLDELKRLTGLPDSWLRKFRQGEIAEPSVNRVELVYQKLTGRKLSV